MDAGRIHFSEDAHVDISRSMGFRNYDTYCVAPITVGDAKLANYDFWAVGTNCCLGSDGRDFRCGEFNNLAAHSGLRLMDDKERRYFRLAVEQAEAAYDIDSNHAVFMYWMQDPDAELQAYSNEGNENFVSAICACVAVQLFLVVLTSWLQSKFS